MGGYQALVRVASDASPKPILDRGGKVRIYPTKDEAQQAIIESICAYVNGNLVRDGEKLCAMSEAEKLFPALVKQRGKERRVVVERKARAR